MSDESGTISTTFTSTPEFTRTVTVIGGDMHPPPRLLRDGETPTKCPQCAKWHVPTPGMENVSCCVMHHGTCCHYSDTEVSAPSWSSPLADIEWGRFA